jgi:GAF domain-containing protein
MPATGQQGRGSAEWHQLGAVMSRVARRLQEEHGDVEATLRAIAASAVESVDAAEQCGITYVIGRSTVESRAATGVLPRSVDALQERLGEGPCLDAVRDEDVVRVDDVATDGRWPVFAREAARLGVGSMLCFQLFVEGDHLGALNLYAGSTGAFDEESQDIGLLFAGHAAVALAGAEHEANLRRGMDHRDVIGQAKGILMARQGLTEELAFDLLRRASQRLNMKLRDVAQAISEGKPPAPDLEAGTTGSDEALRRG